jgi:hypothetical protein
MKEEQYEAGADQGNRQPWRQVIAQTCSEAERHEPVKEWRLFKPGLAPETRRNPVSRFSHFAADGSISRLIRTQESGCGESVEKQKEHYGRGK